MSDKTIIFFLTGIIIVLLLVIFYQRFVFTRGTQLKIKKINKKLAEILETDSDEKVMVFTDNKVLMELGAQINRLLIDRQKIKVDFKKEELSSKKMLSNISHDMKTPLTVILGYLEIMRLDSPTDKVLEKVENKANQVMELIQQFFTLAKLESGDMNLVISRIKINELCRENVLSFYDILSQKNFEVDISIPEKAIFVQGNAEAIQRILFNLISNAIRYGKDGKYIGVSLREDENHVYIDVMDKGMGIEKEFASNVFERLYTMEDSRNCKIQGNGLGLTIAKNLATQLGGDITLKSEPYVKTVFTVILKKIVY